ncbi:hypothetical protein L228DRAFT_119366 [Xylona heveae TC161]|uniref:Uncharacterized protein n=1 Tax=Xylona heveae (strain CBS 132557 / TC161) TaxID=1328760 RepID=A0A165HHY0_XYLHT|nr:hypothetical protein L228DRAFT_119366 [Xylona heveae TC161]KZF23546.1 hypothetical protein L228DRAFT_119366 [Xylona heveae TC161]
MGQMEEIYTSSRRLPWECVSSGSAYGVSGRSMQLNCSGISQFSFFLLSYNPYFLSTRRSFWFLNIQRSLDILVGPLALIASFTMIPVCYSFSRFLNHSHHYTLWQIFAETTGLEFLFFTLNVNLPKLINQAISLNSTVKLIGGIFQFLAIW